MYEADFDPTTIEKPTTLPSKILEEYGWFQDEYGDTCRGFCSMGAIYYGYTDMNMADYPDEFRMSAAQRDSVWKLSWKLSKLLSTKAGTPISIGLVSWNDADERTKDEVINLFKEVEKELGWLS